MEEHILTRMGFSLYLLALSAVLFGGFINAQGQNLVPCNVSGETRLTFYQNSSFPQICTYINTSIVNTNLTTVSGFYYIFMCYDGGWGSENRETFCFVSGYIGSSPGEVRLSIPNLGEPKYTNATCNGDEIEFLYCGGGVTTSQCDYVSQLTCSPCSAASDCLGGSNSLCSMGVCSCIECANGVCYAGGCLCNTGWEGATCNQSLCNPTCQNGGTCQNNATCFCPFPYTGGQCLMNLTCDPVCLNGGQCNVDLSSATFQCSCVQGYAGSHCQTLLTTNPPNQTLATPNQTLLTTNPPNPTTLQSEVTTNALTTEVPTISLGTISHILVVSIVVPMLVVLVILLIAFGFCFFCFSFFYFKRIKKYTNLEGPGLDDVSLNPYEERKPTIYSTVDEAAMLEYGNPPPIPSERKDDHYEVKKKTSHYEVEDPVLEVRTYRHKLTERQGANKIIVEDLGEGNDLDDPQGCKNDLPPPVGESPYLTLLENSSTQEQTPRAYSNPSLVNDSNIS